MAGAQSSLACPDAKRNLLDDLNLAENTLLPAPGDKESVAVFLRVKPRWGREEVWVSPDSWLQDRPRAGPY